VKCTQTDRQTGGLTHTHAGKSNLIISFNSLRSIGEDKYTVSLYITRVA